MWIAFKRYHGKPDSDVVFLQKSTLDLNPTFDSVAIEKEYEEDPANAAAEYGAQFRSDIESFIARESVEAAVFSGRIELLAVPGIRYDAFLDFAGGSPGGDSAAVAIAHEEKRDNQKIVVLDGIREMRPPFSPEQVCADFAALLKTYRITSATADRWAEGFASEHMRKFGVTMVPSKKPKSELYREFLPLLNSGRVELLDVPRLAAQLAGLERRTARGGRDSIDHPPGGHDDVANVACGVCVSTGLLAYRRGGARSFDMFSGEIVSGWDGAGNEWRDGRPWNGTFPPDTDSKGRPLSHWARFVNGAFDGHVVKQEKDQSS